MRTPSDRWRPDHARGVFETMLVRAGSPVELHAHLARLGASLASLYALPVPRDAVSLVHEHAQGLDLGRLRLTVAPSANGAHASVTSGPVAPEIVFPGWDGAASLSRLSVAGGIGEHKWADRGLLEQAEERSAPAVPLVLDADDAVLECSRASVFLVEGESVITPRADGRILPGIARERVLEIARELGIPVAEDDVPLARLLTADEVFLTGSIRGVEPVRTLERSREWREGTVTARLSQALQRRWAGEPVSSPGASRP